MIFIFIISIINALYIIANNYSNWFFKFISTLLIFILIFTINFKQTFLPFLGSTIFPLSLIPNQMYPPKSNFSTDIDLFYPNGSKVIYWSANPDLNNKDLIFDNPSIAYADFKNCGVAIINNNKATLHLYCPNKYKIPTGSILDKHIHYRVAFPDNPILTDVKTIYIKC